MPPEPGVLLAEPCAFFQEAGPFGMCGFQAAQQRGVGGALAGRDRLRAGPGGGVPEARDLGADVGLGVEPGPGHQGRGGDGLEGDRGTGAVEFA